jgi:hypothetical protein
MHENGNPINPRRDVPQYLNPLATHLRFEMSEPGNVAARSRQLWTKPLPTGSATMTKTMGVLAARGCNCANAGLL